MSLTLTSKNSSVSNSTCSSSTTNCNVKADISNFLEKLDAYSSTIPVEVTAFHLAKSGVNVKDSRIPILISLAADKFLAEIIYEAKQITLVNSEKLKTKRQRDEMNATLSIEALCKSLKRRKISIDQSRYSIVAGGVAVSNNGGGGDDSNAK